MHLGQTLVGHCQKRILDDVVVGGLHHVAAAFDFHFSFQPAPPDDDVASECTSIELSHDAMTRQHFGHFRELGAGSFIYMVAWVRRCNHRLRLGLVQAMRPGRALDQFQMCWQRLAAGHIRPPGAVARMSFGCDALAASSATVWLLCIQIFWKENIMTDIWLPSLKTA